MFTPRTVIDIARNGKSYKSISRMMGKQESYVSQSLNGRAVGSQVMVDILDALGYDTIVRQRANGDEMRLSPSREEIITPHALTISIQGEQLREKIQQYNDDGTLEERLSALL